MIRPWELPNSDGRKVLFIAVTVSFVCSLVVSSAHIILGPIREANIEEFQQSKLQSMLADIPGLKMTSILGNFHSRSMQMMWIYWNTVKTLN